MVNNASVNYWDYLQVPKLLNLQNGLNDNNVSVDELHFIIVHQVFELWFKQVISEIKFVRDKLNVARVEEENIPIIVHHLQRVVKILTIASDHFVLMETLTPQDFLNFRSKLGTASGFQSFQMRQIELLLGLTKGERENYNHDNPIKFLYETSKHSIDGSEIVNLLEKTSTEKNLLECVLDWIYRTPIQGSGPNSDNDNDIVDEFISGYLERIKEINETQMKKLIEDGGDINVKTKFEESYNEIYDFLNAVEFNQSDSKDFKLRMKRIRAGILFIESYRNFPLVSWPRILIDSIVELEECFIKFRFNHARMVERIIGRRIGTGGSSGVDYLDETTKYRIFKDLWKIRTILLPSQNLPPLKNVNYFQFVSEVD
ncbi:MAG: tryptophan 2,3-dioxygenase [Candidatus Heimdallarchaeota archaeon]|nr:tryptophan 2,3-dioxygenase [Candidatus Heimdallarchaeota archaeon]